MSEFPITHPPLAREIVDAIASRHKSPDAILLLREVERLIAVQGYARQMLAYADAGNMARVKWTGEMLQGAIEGRLPGGRFKAD
jgi:hypothetical protein